jgi:hypothetical protein
MLIFVGSVVSSQLDIGGAIATTQHKANAAASSSLSQTFGIAGAVTCGASNKNCFINANSSRIMGLISTITLSGPLIATPDSAGYWSDQVNAYTPPGYVPAYMQFVITTTLFNSTHTGVYLQDYYIEANDGVIVVDSGQITQVPLAAFTTGTTIAITVNVNGTGNVVGSSGLIKSASGKVLFSSTVVSPICDHNGYVCNAQAPIVGIENQLIGDCCSDTAAFTQASGTMTYNSATPMISLSAPAGLSWVQYNGVGKGTTEKSNIRYQGISISTSSSSSTITSVESGCKSCQSSAVTQTPVITPVSGKVGQDLGTVNWFIRANGQWWFKNPGGDNLTGGIVTATWGSQITPITLPTDGVVYFNSSTYALHLIAGAVSIWEYLNFAAGSYSVPITFSGTLPANGTVNIHIFNPSHQAFACDSLPHTYINLVGVQVTAPACQSLTFGSETFDWSAPIDAKYSPSFNNVTEIISWHISLAQATNILIDPIALDGSNIGSTNSGSSQTVNLTTTYAPDVIIAIANTFNQNATGVSDTGGASLTWHHRMYKAQAGSGYTTYMNSWWAATTATVLTADPIKVTTSTNTYITLMVFGVVGANTVTPFDSNGALPAKNGANNNPHANAQVTFSTSNANDFLFIAYDSSDNEAQTWSTVSTGYTQIQAGASSTEVPLAAIYQVFTTTQTSVTVVYIPSVTTTVAWIEYADAIVQAKPSIVQTKACTGTGSVGTCNFDANTLAGDTSVVVVGDIVSTAVSTVVDTQSLTYTLIVAKDVGSTGDTEGWWACDTLTAAADSVNATFSVSVTWAIVLYELTPTTGCVVSSSTGSGGPGTTSAVGSYTPANPSLVIGGLNAVCTTSCAYSAGSGYSKDQSIALNTLSKLTTESKQNLGTAETTPLSSLSTFTYNEISMAFTFTTSITTTLSFSPSITLSPTFNPSISISRTASISLSGSMAPTIGINFAPTIALSPTFSLGWSFLFTPGIILLPLLAVAFASGNSSTVTVTSTTTTTSTQNLSGGQGFSLLLIVGIVVCFMIVGLIAAKRR